MNTKILLPVFLFFLLLTLFSTDIPFFWDGTFFSGLALHFYENGFNNFIAPQTNDTGGFPLFSAYLTFMWKLFGKTLLVSHVALLPFLLGVSYEYFKLAKRFINTNTIIFAMALLLIEPVLITQSILMGYDIVISYFFLLAMNAIYADKKTVYSVALFFLCMISLRGIMLASALFIIDILKNRTLSFQLIKAYLPAILLLFCWMIYHRHQTGWYVFSPAREDNAEQFGGIKMMFRQLIYIGWKNIDLGRIALWVLFAFAAIYHFRKKKLQDMIDLLRMVLVPLLILSAFMILIKNPIGHKYFLPVFLVLNIAACYVIDKFENKKSKRVLFILTAASLIAGNFILYPQRYGNSWDSSLKIIPYFDLSHKMKEHIQTAMIDPAGIGTQFPLTSDLRFSYLSDSSCRFSDIENKPIKSFPYFLYSNIINTNRIDEIEIIQKSWIEEKKFEKGLVILTLYKNPDL